MQYSFIMSLQLVRTHAQQSFAQKMAKLEIYCLLTGKTVEDCLKDALEDYINVVVEAKLDNLDQPIFVTQNFSN